MKRLLIKISRGICYQENVNFENDKLVFIDIFIKRVKKIVSAEQSLKKFS
jgi:hypothetical protein